MYFLPLSFLEDIEEQVCPVLLQLTAGESNDDYRSEAVAVSLAMSHSCMCCVMDMVGICFDLKFCIETKGK